MFGDIEERPTSARCGLLWPARARTYFESSHCNIWPNFACKVPLLLQPWNASQNMNSTMWNPIKLERVLKAW